MKSSTLHCWKALLGMGKSYLTQNSHQVHSRHRCSLWTTGYDRKELCFCSFPPSQALQKMIQSALSDNCLLHFSAKRNTMKTCIEFCLLMPVLCRQCLLSYSFQWFWENIILHTIKLGTHSMKSCNSPKAKKDWGTTHSNGGTSSPESLASKNKNHFFLVCVCFIPFSGIKSDS